MPSFKHILRSPFLYALASPILLSLAETPFDVGILRWVALVPLLILIDSPTQKRKRLFFIWLSFLLYITGQYSLVWSTLPFEWLRFESVWYARIALGFFFLLYPSLIALSALLFYYAHKKIYLFPILFIIVEYLRSIFFSALTLGAPSSVADNLSYGLLAYSVHGSEALLRLAPLLGIYGFSFFIATINTCIYALFKNKPFARTTIAAGTLLCIFFVGIEFFAFPTREKITGKIVPVISIERVVPARFTQIESYPLERALLYESRVREALREHPETELIILPENSQFIPSLARERDTSEEDVITDLLGKDTERMLVYGDYDYEEKQSRISFVSNLNPKMIRSLQKEILMPFGEYQPYIAGWLAKRVGGASWLEEIELYRELHSGEDGERTIEWRGNTIVGASCSEIFAPYIYSNLKKDPPNLIIQVQRLVIFHNDTRVWKHALAASQLYAATLRTYIVGSVDGGEGSYIIDPKGKLIGEKNESGYIYGTLHL